MVTLRKINLICERSLDYNGTQKRKVDLNHIKGSYTKKGKKKQSMFNGGQGGAYVSMKQTYS